MTVSVRSYNKFIQLFKMMIFLTAYFMCMRASGQADIYKFSHLDVYDGLSNNQVNSIWKDQQGFMWFGTLSGLNRYDGYEFKVFRRVAGDSTSLTDNYIDKLFEDHLGNLWVNTRIGFNIYNPVLENFDRNITPYLEQLSLPTDIVINSIAQDNQGDYWYITVGDGLYFYNDTQKSVRHLPLRNNAENQPVNIMDVAENGGDSFWIIYADGVLEQYDKRSLKMINSSAQLSIENKSVLLNYKILTDREGDLWCFAVEDPRGVYYYQPKDSMLLHFHKNSKQVRLNNNVVRDVVLDSTGLVWIGTDHGGINLLNKHTLEVQYLMHKKYDNNSISENTIYDLYREDNGTIWVGTFKKGISFYHKNLVRFPIVQQQESEEESLPYDDANCFAEDAQGNLWIGTNGGGIIYYDREHQTFQQFLHDPEDPNSLSNNVVVSLFIDHEGYLWIGTYYGGLNRYDGENFVRYRHDPDNPQSLADDRVWEIYEDSRHNLWIGTLGSGLDLFDREKGVFYHYRMGDQNSVHSDYIASIREDQQERLWIGTAYGVDVLDLNTGRFHYYNSAPGNPHSLSNFNVNFVLVDSLNRVWIGTREGLNLYDPEKDGFRVFKTKDGLSDNTIQAILEDDQHNLWISTPQGLSHMVLEGGLKDGLTYRFNNYNKSDGLQKEFNTESAFKTSQGELIFGGPNGFNIFMPESIEDNTITPKVVITDLRLYDQSIQPGEEILGDEILSQSITLTKEVVLSYQHNMVSFAFSALNFHQPEKNQYQYKLEGFNNQWLTTDSKSRVATYTNLAPGEYTLKVKASNNDNLWNETGTSLKITILPPFWKTSWAIGLYALIIIFALLLARRLVTERARMNFRLEQQSQEAQRMFELDMMKTKFFTNVSHEFRTPLSLILTPLESIIKHTGDNDLKKHLEMVHRNARRLLNLVNQLLDFRKLEVQEVRLNPSEGDIIKFIEEVSYSFTDLSENKNIGFSFHSFVPALETYFDQDKLEKILFNLLSNAFKFTPERGHVSVEVDYADVEHKPHRAPAGNRAERWTLPQQQWQHPLGLAIRIKDTGIGIPAEKQDRIFDKFFQNEISGPMVNQGSGIGLSIANEFVKLHKGRILVESQPEKGSCFTVLLPVKALISPDKIPALAAEPVDTEVVDEAVIVSEPAGEKAGGQPLVMLIEDHEDFRFYLKDNLKGYYRVAEASQGKEGWQQIKKLLPDLIVSDIMMPEMNGIDLCKKIKTDPRTSHIPVILLTARSDDAQKLEGLSVGADDYVTKPFSFEILESRIKNLIHQREVWKKNFHQQVDISPSEINITSLDEKLIKTAIELVEKNMANADFSVEELSRELGISRVHLYKKLTAITGKSPVEFIRFIRLKRASQLLEKSQLTVAEVAYQVGFNNPKYFSKYFKTEFNVLPSAYASRFRE